MASAEKIKDTIEQVAGTARDSYLTLVDHSIALQERNVSFAQEVVDSSIKELREQAESNRTLAEELVERAEKQREAFQPFFKESLDSSLDLVYAPFAYYKEGLEVAKKAAQ